MPIAVSNIAKRKTCQPCSGSVEPAAATVRLAPLSEAGTAAALAALEGEAVPEDFARACHAWTGGNPRPVAATAAELAAEGLAPGPEATRRLGSLQVERHPLAALKLLYRSDIAAHGFVLPSLWRSGVPGTEIKFREP